MAIQILPGTPVVSVNTQTGVVVLDADDIDDAATTNKFLTAAELTKLGGIEDGANLYVHPNHTGDVTSVADGATTIAADAVTNAKLADMADATIKGRAEGAGTGNPVDLTPAQVRAIINVEEFADPTTADNVGTLINEAAADTPLDADKFVFWDVVDNVIKSVTWTNVKATLKTYLDTLYVALTGAQDVGGVKNFTSGIKFGAATMTRYDTGTFTPQVADALSGGNVASGTMYGRYFVTGLQVTLWMSLSNINTSGMTGGNPLYIRNLPFVALNEAGYYAVGSMVASSMTISGGLWANPMIEANTSYLVLYEMVSGTDLAVLTVSDVAASGFSDLYITISYAGQ